MKFSLTITTILLLAVFLLTGCNAGGSSTSTSRKALSILVANSAARESPNTNNEAIRKQIIETIESQGYINIVNVDGAPAIVYEKSFELDARYANASSSKLHSDAVVAANSVMEKLQTVQADSPENDLLKAISVSSNALSEYQDYRKNMIIIDSGLSTAGELNFQNNLINAEPEIISKLLEERSSIPNLAGINVSWYSLSVESPQKLSNKQAEQITNIWQAIVESGGGSWDSKTHVINSTPHTSKVISMLPFVSVVELPNEAPIRFDKEVVNTKSDLLFTSATFIDEEQIAFHPDSSSYLYPEKALQTLEPVSDYLIQHSDITLLLAGTIAGDTNSPSGIRLSLARASAVRDSLVELGVSASQLIVRGLGCTDPWHIYGVGYNSSASIQNRKVVLVDASTDTARKILDEYEN